MNAISKKLIEAVKNDLTRSLGVTEPGAIAYAAAGAARAVGGRVKKVHARLNSGIYKNSFTCAVPGTDGMGCALAAALGAVAGEPAKRLMATEFVSNADADEAKRFFSSDAERRCSVTAYALARGARIEYCFWWLRSAGVRGSGSPGV